MKQKVVTARVTEQVYAEVQRRADADGVSLSAAAAQLIAEGISAQSRADVDEKPAWVIAIEALEARVSQLEQRGQGRKGKRRR